MSTFIRGSAGVSVGIRGVDRVVDPDGTLSEAPQRIRGSVRLWSPERSVTVTAEHNEIPKVSRERAGGWRVVERQGQLAATTWDGSPPLQLQLKLIIDGKTGRATPVPVKDIQDRLRLLGYQVRELGRPPRIRVIGAVPYSDGGVLDHASSPPWWVLEALEFDDRDFVGGVVSQTVASVTLLEFVDTAVAEQQTIQSGYSKYQWKKGDTLSTVADDRLGDEDLADWIRKANPKLTKAGWSKVAPGTIVLIPRLRTKNA